MSKKIKLLKLNYYCFMYYVFKFMKIKSKMTDYWAKIIVNYGYLFKKEPIISEYDL